MSVTPRPYRRPTVRYKTRGEFHVVRIRTGAKWIEFELDQVPELIARLEEIERELDMDAAGEWLNDDEAQAEWPGQQALPF